MVLNSNLEMDEEFWYLPQILQSGILNKPNHSRDLKDLRKRLGNDTLAIELFQEIAKSLPDIVDSGLALTSLDRLLVLTQSPAETVKGWLTEKSKFRRFIRLLGSSSFLSQILIQQYPDIMNLIFFQDQQIRRDPLVQLAISLTCKRQSEKEVTDVLRKFRLEWTLVIASADLLDQLGISETTRFISHLADACLEAALAWSMDRARKRFGIPLTTVGTPCQLVAIALGKLGGVELNYSSDVDLIFICDEDGKTNSQRPIHSSEFFSRVITDFLKILGGSASSSFVLRVDLRLRPEGNQGPLLMNLEQTLAYYDTVGRTWERQALIKMRPCAGSLQLGEEFCNSIEPFVYQRYLTSIEIAEIQALKRRIEHRAKSTGVSEWDVKTGHGGIRDIEFVVQFLQLLNGRSLKDVRNANSLEAMFRLKNAGCLNADEYESLQRNYIFLRKVEHRLQLSDDRQTHQIPVHTESRRRLADQMGYKPGNQWESPDGPFERFSREYQLRTSENNANLNRLLHHAFFTEDPQGADPLSDLILDPEMPEDMREQALNPIGFLDSSEAFENLQKMAREESPYFSSPRCRHFFAALVPKLLKTIQNSPSPDHTLAQMENLSKEIPGKALFWERLNAQPDFIQSFYEIATFNRIARESVLTSPELIQNWSRFALNTKPMKYDEIQTTIDNSVAIDQTETSALRNLRDELWLNVSLQNHLPYSTHKIQEITQQLSDIATGIIQTFARQIYEEGLIRWRQITSQTSGPGSWAILALGKLGGEDILFHSDLDLMFLHEINPGLNHNRLKLAAEGFFQDLASRFIRGLGGVGPKFVYRVDTRLRPFGSSGPLSISIEQFQKYYQSKDARIWERLALLRARPVYLNGIPELEIRETIRQMTFLIEHTQSEISQEINELRNKTLSSSEEAAFDLKRASGGLHEAELLVQGLQLLHLGKTGNIPVANFQGAVHQLQNIGAIDLDVALELSKIYSYYRQVETGIRILRNRATNPLVIHHDEIPYLEQIIDQNTNHPFMTIHETIRTYQNEIHQIYKNYFHPPKV